MKLPLRYLSIPFVLLAALASAQPADLEKRLSDLDKATKSAQSAGDTAWMLVCSALVLMMTGPGLALFYGGLVRRKNVLGTMMQSFVLMALVTVIWALVGYSFAFGESTPFFGGFNYVFLHNVGAAPNADYAGTIPQSTFMIYQLMFAIITPALISGAFAERMKFSAMLLFMTLWMFIVYFPMAHMVWGKGGFLNATLGGKIPCFDFAGGTVVHISTSGASRKRWFAPISTWESARDIPMSRCVRGTAWVLSDGRRVPFVGRLVRIQRGIRIGRFFSGHQRFRRDPLRLPRCRPRLDGRGMDAHRQA